MSPSVKTTQTARLTSVTCSRGPGSGCENTSREPLSASDRTHQPKTHACSLTCVGTAVKPTCEQLTVEFGCKILGTLFPGH